MREPDWTGSGSQRRPQGTCKPPSDPDSIVQQYLPAGTHVTTKPRRGTYDQWREYTTQVTVPIEEILKQTEKSVLFAYKGWVIAVSPKLIRHRTIL